MDQNNSLLQILEELGYCLTSDKDGWRTNAQWRNGDNPTAIKIYNNGRWVDFVQNTTGTIEDLIRLTLGLPSNEKAIEFLKVKNYNHVSPEIIKPKIKMAKIYDPSYLEKLLPRHEYFLNRGISEATLKEFRGGLCLAKSKFYNYYVFPVWNYKKELIGFAGRNTDASSTRPKWIMTGNKKEFKFPLFLNYSILKEMGEVILVESIGNILALWECNIKNTICCFGTGVSLAILNVLLKINSNKIIISFDNDAINGGDAGNIESEKVQKKLLKYFNRDQIQILLPQKYKDWNEILINAGKDEIIQQLC